jgi:hypothetical protein
MSAKPEPKDGLDLFVEAFCIPHPNSAYRDCPEAGMRWEFNRHGDDKQANEREADLYLQIALHTWFSFKEIFAMQMFLYHGPEAFRLTMASQNFGIKEDIPLILQEIAEEERKDTELMQTYKLPLRELLEVFFRAQARAKRFADLFPQRRQAILAEVEEAAEKMMGLIYRYQQKQLDH